MNSYRRARTHRPRLRPPVLKLLECEEAPFADCGAPLKKHEGDGHQAQGDEGEYARGPGDAEVLIHCTSTCISPLTKVEKGR